MYLSPPRETARARAVALVAPVRSRAAALFTAFALVVTVLAAGAVTAPPAGASSVEDTFTSKINKAHQASKAEQIRVAERVLANQGWKAWPSCSKKLGLRGSD